MKIAIIGGGNIGTLMAAEMSNSGHKVSVYTSKPSKWCKSIDILDNDDGFILNGKIAVVTDNIEAAVNDADVVFVTVPAQLFKSVAQKLLPIVNEKQIIGIVPGSGGAEFAFRGLIEKGCTIFGLQRVHSIARIKEYGKSVYMLGKKPNIQIGVIPKNKTDEVAEIAEKLFLMPCKKLSNYLCVTLTPSNPILHTSRLYSMFKEYANGVLYPRNFLFYEEWCDESSEVLFAMDSELQALCNVIPLELKQGVISLPKHYESETPEALTQKIKSIKAFKGLTSPMLSLDEGKWIPDFKSRYFTADFNFGLKIILDLCRLYNVNAPNIEKVWKWYLSVTNEKIDAFDLSLTKNDFLDIYK